MTSEIKVREGENIESAISRFRKAVQNEYGRRWYKRRLGYYEKPSVLRRKKKKMAKIQSGRGVYLLLCIDQQALFSRTGPTSAAGR